MASITIRDLPDKTKTTLRVHAAQNGVSLESYVRQLLNEASKLNQQQSISILDLAEKHFGKNHGVDLKLPARNTERKPIEFD
ncbi:hypothetical protein K8I31_14850 [bacterium]|nr:hypothetical protein [bacterium]